MRHPFYGPNSQFLGQENSRRIGLASMLLYLFFWAVVMIYAFRLVKKYFLKEDGLSFKEDKALEILRERYVNGEIDYEEFRQKKAAL
ncbi:hypothetical protein GH810_10775 [Acetobacterium paludosum]|uniref:SHOCT domain-containing protein n=1 Tax=Acetobacterium paludosum TaxID=52693 RepID=A0A923HV00_9FIRM|nr:SHOCT domain-containing protein [Acetobacterium paludosum]MBC3888796.1 hypothetical protein [Acetobacterium paludosum]